MAAVVLLPGTATSNQDEPQNNVLARALAVDNGEVTPTKFDKALSAGVMRALHAAYDEDEGAAAGAAAFSASSSANDTSVPPSDDDDTNGCPKVFKGHPDNIRVNQDCSLRRQAEEWVGVNPRDFSNVLAGQNDSMVGFNHCGYDWSLNRGNDWERRHFAAAVLPGAVSDR